MKLPSAFVVRNVILTLLALKPFTQAFQEFTRSSPMMVMGTYCLRNLYGPMIAWPAPADTLDNCLIWVTGLFLFTCWSKQLQIVTVGGLFFFMFYLFQISTWCMVTDFPPGAAGMFAIGTIILALLMWTLSAPAKFGLDYDTYKWLIVGWGVVCFAINAVWLSIMQENKNALAPEIANFKKKMKFFDENGGLWDVGSDCPAGFKKGPCALIPSGLPEVPLVPYVPIAVTVPLVYLAVAFVLSKKVREDAEPMPSSSDYYAMKH